MRLDINDADVNWNEVANHITSIRGDSELPQKLVIEKWVIEAINAQMRSQKQALAQERRGLRR